MTARIAAAATELHAASLFHSYHSAEGLRGWRCVVICRYIPLMSNAAPHHPHGHHHGHGLGHSHGHNHGHGHAHAPADYGRAFALGVTLNLAFVAVEGTAGLLTDSVALLADAGHNLSDVLGLLLAWGAAALSRRAANKQASEGRACLYIVSHCFAQPGGNTPTGPCLKERPDTTQGLSE